MAGLLNWAAVANALATILFLSSVNSQQTEQLQVHTCNDQEWVASTVAMSYRNAVHTCQILGFTLANPIIEEDRNCMSRFPANADQYRWVDLVRYHRYSEYFFCAYCEPREYHQSTFNFWARGQPDNHRKLESHVVQRGGDTRLYGDVPASFKAGFICRRSTGSGHHFGTWSSCYLNRQQSMRLKTYRRCRSGQCYSVRQEEICPTDGQWSVWGAWSECSATCGNGQRLRRRICNNPPPANNGRDCAGNSMDMKLCVIKLKGQFCPGSFQFPGCAKCYGLNNSTTFEDAKRVCSNKSAGSRVVSFLSQHELSDWRNFISSLPITGFKFWVIQSLTTRNGQPGCTVYDSSSRELQRVACSDKHFTACERGPALNGGFSDWSKWSNCSTSCGVGVETRTRQCNNPTPKYEGTDCPGLLQENRRCDPAVCLEWEEERNVTSCIVSCGYSMGVQLVAKQCRRKFGSQSEVCPGLGLRWHQCEDKVKPCSHPLVGEQWQEYQQAMCPIDANTMTSRIVTRSCTAASGNGEDGSQSDCQDSKVDLCNQGATDGVPSCLKPEDITNGAYHYVTDDRIEYTCNYGYQLDSGETANVFVKFCNNGAWSPATALSCIAITCQDPGSLQHGRYQVSGNKQSSEFGDLLTAECDEGYRLGNSSMATRTCLANGKWSGFSAVCTVVRCEIPSKPGNSVSRIVGDYEFRSMQWIYCKKGYQMDTHSPIYSRQCLATGFWSDDNMPTCKAIRCKELRPSEHMEIRRPRLKYGTTASYLCEPGYELLPLASSSRKCIADCPERTTTTGIMYVDCGNGQWDGEEPTCKPVSCPPISAPEHGQMMSQSGEEAKFHYGLVKTFSCNNGFYLESVFSQSRRCQATGQWTGKNATCLRVSCGDPEVPNAGYVSKSGTVFENVALISCLKGYSMADDDDGKVLQSCNAIGEWIPRVKPVCKVITCPELSSTGNLHVDHDGLEYNSTATYTCNTGFQLNPLSPRRTCTATCTVQEKPFKYTTCMEGGHWTDSDPTCEPVPCQELSAPDNGQMMPSVEENQTFHFNIIKNFSCNSGFYLKSQSSQSRRCDENGQWTGEHARCLRVSCGEPVGPENGQTSKNGVLYEATALFSCGKGHMMLPPYVLKHCSAQGDWIPGIPPVCKAITCPKLSVTFPLQLEYNHMYGSEAVYSCAPGYETEGRVNLIRQCTAECPTESIGDFQYIACRDGYWTGGTPICKRIQCPALSDPDNGAMMQEPSENGDFRYQVVKKFSCNDGYYLQDSSSQSRQCQADRTWSGSTAKCLPVDCGRPIVIPNGWEILQQGTTYQAVQVLGCNYPFYMDYHAPRLVRSCLANGHWSDPELPMCIGLKCPAPTETPRLMSDLTTNVLLHSSQVARTDALASVVHFCPVGFAVSRGGQKERTCLSRCGNWYSTLTTKSYSVCYRTSTEWSGVPPTCKRVPCGVIRAPSNGKLVGMGQNSTVESFDGVFEDTLTVKCNHGSKLRVPQHNRYTCDAAGQWVGDAPVCVPVCYEVKCDELRRCVTSSGDGNRHACVCDTASDCPDDYNPVCGTDGNDYVNSCIMLVAACNQNKTISVAKDGFCEVAGKCSEERPRMPQGSFCPAISRRYFYNRESSSCEAIRIGRCFTGGGRNSFQQLSTCRSTCEQSDVCDYDMDKGPCNSFARRYFYNRNTRKCESFEYGGCFGSENNFATEELCNEMCLVSKCPQVHAPANGQITGRRREIGSSVTYSCDEGYDLLGLADTDTRTCQPNEMWTGSEPACKKPCPPSYCKDYAPGTCSLDDIRPVEACSADGIGGNDVGIVARVNINTNATCTASNAEYIVTLRVREEIRINAQRCRGFMPGVINHQRYDVNMVLKFERGCPCPFVMKRVTYIITATCDPQDQVLRTNSFSLFREHSDRTEDNLKRRCSWN